MAHFAMLTIVIFDQTAHLEASVVPDYVPVAEESKISFTVCLVLTMCSIIVEFASIAIELPSIPRSLCSTISHAIATWLILLFIYDSHPPSHFWLLLLFFSAVPCSLAIRVIVQKLSAGSQQ
ncbi:unnamed protein product [Caenorhabditis sp. 36 PRJEB53466]|nr:unnamed protein product [Caenorhabditis sp. 36 PRJEB53466]